MYTYYVKFQLMCLLSSSSIVQINLLLFVLHSMVPNIHLELPHLKETEPNLIPT